MTATVTRQQYFDAVAALSGMNLLYQSLEYDANNPDWIEFNSAKYVSQGDPLYVQTQMALGYNSAEMQFLFDIALGRETIAAQVVRNRKGLPVLDRAGDRVETR